MVELHAGDSTPWLPPGPLQTDYDSPTRLFHERHTPGGCSGGGGAGGVAGSTFSRCLDAGESSSRLHMHSCALSTQPYNFFTPSLSGAHPT